MSAPRTERQRSQNKSLPKGVEDEIKLSAKKSTTEGSSSADESNNKDASSDNHGSSQNQS